VVSKSLVDWLKILWENENEYVVCEELLCAAEPLSVCLSVCLSAAGGSPPLL
jgi:hypothetical protein